MEKITINDKVYKIPTSWDEMNFGQFIKLSDYIQTISEDEHETYSDELFYSKVLNILIGVPLRTFKELSVVNMNLFINSIKFISTKFENAPYTKEIHHDDLVIKIRNFEEFKYGEYIDMLHLSTQEGNGNLIKVLSLMSDVYQRKNYKKLKFRDKKLNFTQEEKELIISSLPATKANAVAAFFLHGQRQSGRNIVSYLNKLAAQMAMKAFFQTVGLFISGLWMRVMKILLSLILLLTFRFDRSLHIWRTKLPRII